MYMFDPYNKSFIFNIQMAVFRSPFFKNPGFSQVINRPFTHRSKHNIFLMGICLQEPFHIPDEFRAFLKETPDWLI